MEATQQNTQPLPETPPPSAAEVSEPTAKQLAAAEETNQLRALKLAEQRNAPPEPEAVRTSDVAARGYDALHEQFRQHNEKQKHKKEYVPPPRTPNQMSRLQEELEAGARSVARAQAQQDAARQAAAASQEPPPANEGFTTPVYRPNDVVPDPMLTGTNKEGLKPYSPDV